MVIPPFRGFFVVSPIGTHVHFYVKSTLNPDEPYFIAETKGSLDSLQLRAIEEAKIACARKHFEAISSDSVKYDVAESYEDLLNRVMK